MARYRVKAGQVLPHHGAVLEAGAEVELPDHVATDIEVVYRVERVYQVEMAPVGEDSALRDFMRREGVDLTVDELETTGRVRPTEE